MKLIKKDMSSDYAKDHELTEKMYNKVGEVFEKLTDRFNAILKEVPDEDKLGKSVKLDYELKYSSALGYIAQVHAGLAKAYHQEKRLSEIEKKLAKIPPEIYSKYINN